MKPALHYVQSTINQHLENRTGARLLWDAKRARLDLYTSPVDLIGAVWLQFARAVERDSQFRQCAECGIWFELAPGTARADKLYCSTPCRTKAYRKRQAEAVRLHGEGRSLEDIARELDSDPDTVRGWIERKGARAARPRASRIAGAGGGGWARTPVPAPTIPIAALPAPIALAPDLMTADERLDEVAQILAAGLLRLRQCQYRNDHSRLEKNSLDFSPDRSGHATARQRRGPAMSDTVLAQIAALKTKSTAELRDMWQELFGREAPVLGRRYLEDRHRLQGSGTALRRPLRPRPAQARRAGRSAGAQGGTPARSRATDRRHAVACASGKASSTSSLSGSMISSTTAAPTDLSPRSRGRSPDRDGMAGCSLASSNGKPDDLTGSQDPLRDLLPQELRGRT